MRKLARRFFVCDVVGSVRGQDLEQPLKEMFGRLESQDFKVNVEHIRAGGEDSGADNNLTSIAFYAEKVSGLKKIVISTEIFPDREYGYLNIDFSKQMRGPSYAKKAEAVAGIAGFAGTLLATGPLQYASLMAMGAGVAGMGAHSIFSGDLSDDDPVVERFDDEFNECVRHLYTARSEKRHYVPVRA